ncbi:MAG: hypothetical protein ACT4O2_15895 [Beijerinckiaceae bacterium]
MCAMHNRRGAAVAVAAVGLVQAIAFPSIAQEEFFDFLFGPFQSRSAGHYEGYFGEMPGNWGPRFHWRAERGFHGHEHRPPARRKLSVAHETGDSAQPPPPADLMDDDSLQPGDAVMTASGIRIFIGSSGTPHAPLDFRKPSEITGFSKRERKALAALDPQGPILDRNSGMATGRSASEPKAVFGKTFIDPRGRPVRYVGP